MKSQTKVWLIAGMVVLLVTGLTLMPAMAQEDVKEKAAPVVEEVTKDKPAKMAADAEYAKPGVCPKCGCSKEKLDDIVASLEKAEKGIADGDMDAAKKAISKVKMQLKMMASKCVAEDKDKAKIYKKADKKPVDAIEPVAPVSPTPPAVPMAPAPE